MLAEVAIPSGGRAWVRTRLSHERSIAKTALFMAVAPAKSIRALQAAKLKGKGNVLDAVAGDEDFELVQSFRNLAIAQAETIRLCVQRWDGVCGPDDGAPLAFPDDVEQLDKADFDALYIGCEHAIERADPNAGGGL